MKLDNPKITRAWSFYDWANSVYSLVITSTIFPIFYSVITSEKGSDVRKKIMFLGMQLEADAVYSYSLAVSFVLVVLLSPVLSSIADTLGLKKQFLVFFCVLGSFSCMGLYFFTDFSQIYYGLGLSILASLGFWGSLVFYNSYLPEIASKEKQDALSARGFIFGYVGSVILLIICLVLMLVYKQSANLCFLITGVWWFGFAQYTFYYLPKGKRKNKKVKNFIFASFRELVLVQKQLFSDINLKGFLLAFFFYSVGMQTIFLMATLFGSSEINLEQEKLIATILLLQIEAILGAYLFSKFSTKYGNKKILIVGIFFWIVACIGGYLLDKNNPNVEYHFYMVAGLVGLVMGGIQSLSRSTYSKMLPKTDDTTTFFSFYDIFEKLAIVIGMFVYGYIIDLTGSMRMSILSMGIFFVVSLFFLLKLRPIVKK
ncbi:MAG: MFS transporter [Flavobacteriales bacterium]|nr:MFS transporter [Flavobacteriales bacterium]